MPFTTLRTFTNQAPEQNIAPGDSEFVSLSGSAIEVSIKNLALSGFSRDAYLRIWRLLDSEKQIIAEYPIRQDDADKRELIQGLSASSSYFAQFASSSPDVRLSGVVIAREAPLGSGGVGGGGATGAEVETAIEAATFADTGLAAIDTDTEALSADPTANTAGTATTAQRPTFFLRWITRLVQIVSRSFVASGSADSGMSIKIGGVYLSTLPTLSSGNRGDIQLSSRGELLIAAVDVIVGPTNVTTADSATSTSVGAEGQILVTGNPTNNSTVTAAVGGNTSFSLEVLGTFTGTYVIERTLDPQNNNQTRWTSVGAFPAGLPVPKSTYTAPGNFHGNSSSATFIRVRFTALSSGAPSVRILAGQGVGTITVGNPIRLSDGTSLAQATIKAASTPVAQTDTAIAVTRREVAQTYTETQLTAPGTTTVRSFAGFSRVQCAYTVANINTSVTVRLEGQTVTSGQWVNVAAGRADTTETANGTYQFFADGRTFENLRFNFVSESGGTAATIDVAMRFSV